MATRLVFLCELCLEEGSETPATPARLSVDDDTGIVDLCHMHMSRYIDPVRRMIHDMSRDGLPQLAIAPEPEPVPVPMHPMSARYYPCAGCLGTARAPYESGSGLGSHLMTVHDIEPPALNALIAVCRVRDCVANTPNAQALAQHVRAVHGFANIPVMLYEQTRTDPETVVDVIDRLLAPLVAPLGGERLFAG
jgi:hypothetical protein